MPRDIVLQRRIKATPEEVYRSLTNPFAIELWSGAPSIMKEEAGSVFEIFGGDISGQNLVFEPNRRIVQEWFFGEDVRSEVTIDLFPDKVGCQIRIAHTGIPDDAYENIMDGWEDSYLGPLKDFFEK